MNENTIWEKVKTGDIILEALTYAPYFRRLKFECQSQETFRHRLPPEGVEPVCFDIWKSDRYFFTEDECLAYAIRKKEEDILSSAARIAEVHHEMWKIKDMLAELNKEGAKDDEQ